MKPRIEKPLVLYLSLSVLAGTFAVQLAPGVVAQVDAQKEGVPCSELVNQGEALGRAAEAIAADPGRIAETLTSLLPSTLGQTVQCVTPTTNSETE
jgi:hypothetical protein